MIQYILLKEYKRIINFHLLLLLNLRNIPMKSRISKSLTISFAIAAALAMPTAVKAQSSNVETTASAISTYADELSTEANGCTEFYIPGLGWFCY